MTNSDEMGQWARDCRGELAMDHENEVFLKVAILGNFLGYKHVAYGLELPTSVAAPAFFLFANYAADWQEKYVERHARHHGSRVAYNKRTNPKPEHDRKYYWQREDFRREAHEHDIKPEWYEQTKGEGGSIAFIALADRAAQCSVGFNQKVRILIDETNAAMRRILLAKHLPQAHVKLNDVERLYMAWVLDGKTSGEIADIMAIPKPSVDNLQRKLPERFGMKGITATAFLAYRLGLLSAPQEAAAG